MTGFILFLTAIVLYIPLTVINIVLVMFRYGVKSLGGYFYQTAVDIDRFGNRNLRTLWNATLITYRQGIKPYYFGDERETISSALGKNQFMGTLSRAGKALCWLLNAIDKDHCFKSIKKFD